MIKMDSTTKQRPRWTTERWRPIVGWEDLYEISDYGRVRRKARNKKSRYKMGKKLLMPAIDRNYRLFVILRDGPYRKKFAIKTLVMAAFIRNYKGGRVICKDGDNKNCHVNNLWEVDNLKKKQLSREELDDVHRRLELGESGASIARLYHLSRAAICIIKRKKRVRDQEEKDRASLNL